MATAAPNQGLPLFYNSIEPINLDQHGKMKVRGTATVNGKDIPSPEVDLEVQFPSGTDIAGAPVMLAMTPA